MVGLYLYSIANNHNCISGGLSTQKIAMMSLKYANGKQSYNGVDRFIL